jgi:hypothetical protein
MVCQWNLFQIATSAAGMYFAIKYKSTLQNCACAWSVNMIYWYSYAEIHIKNAMKSYIGSSKQPPVEEGSLFYLKDNHKVKLKKHQQTVTFPDNMDLMIYSSSILSVVVDVGDDEVEWINNSNIKSDTEFINITVNFNNDPKQYDISLNTSAMNLYAVGNRINKYIIWYLAKLQHDVDRYGIPYSIQLMDNDVNIVNYTEYVTIVIRKDGYYIEQDEHTHDIIDPVK